jgi:hypothetical protein
VAVFWQPVAVSISTGFTSQEESPYRLTDEHCAEPLMPGGTTGQGCSSVGGG